MSNRIDELFAEIATSRQFVSREEIERARAIQSGERETRRIGTILLAHRYITKNQADSVLAEIRDRLGKTAQNKRGETARALPSAGRGGTSVAKRPRSVSGPRPPGSDNGDPGKTRTTHRAAPARSAATAAPPGVARAHWQDVVDRVDAILEKARQ